MKKLLNTTELVKMVLEEKPETRDDDNLLWLEVVREYVRDWKNGSKMFDLTFAFALKNIQRLGIPSFETVSRARRKIQEKNPNLRGSEKVRRKRAEREEVFKEYARNA